MAGGPVPRLPVDRRAPLLDASGRPPPSDAGLAADEFFLEDDDPGISEHDREHVFEVGYTTREDGTGFGLRIVQEIAEAHGWSARVTESATGGACLEVAGVDLVAA